MPATKMTYDSQGNGRGWVGEHKITAKIRTIAPGQYSGRAATFMGLWSANDGNWTVQSDGILRVHFPSNGITEYWYREDGQGKENLVKAQAKQGVALFREASHDDYDDCNLPVATATLAVARPLMVLFRKIDRMGIGWHWALGIGEPQSNPSIYELGGMVAIKGPKGIVHETVANKMARRVATWPNASGTKMDQFQGFVIMKNQSTLRTDDEVESFSKQWVIDHPIFNPMGPNCQTFTEDVYIYCTGQNLQFNKIGDLKSGPEKSKDVVWLK